MPFQNLQQIDLSAKTRVRSSASVRAFVVGLFSLLSVAGSGQAPHNLFAAKLSNDPTSAPPRDWAADAAQNEIKIVRYNSPFLRYRIHQVDAKGDQVRDVIESKDGTVARIILRDNRQLTHDEDAAERQRLQAMLDSPDAFAKHIRGDQTGKKTAVEMINLMPDAMLYSYTPGQPQRSGSHGPEIVLDFRPNPAWDPPTMTSQALTGLAGRLWIDEQTHVLTRMEGEIVHGVNFGFGFFAHIFPGGKLMLEQYRISDQRSIFSHFSQDVTVRALMVKTIKVNSDIQSSHFAEVGSMSYRDAISLLLSTPLPPQ